MIHESKGVIMAFNARRKRIIFVLTNDRGTSNHGPEWKKAIVKPEREEKSPWNNNGNSQNPFFCHEHKRRKRKKKNK